MQHKRLFISADIEGVAGVVSREQCSPSGFEFEQAREWMTAEVVAVCKAAFDSGIREIVVADSHGNGQNILVDQLPENVQLIRSWPRPLMMMEGVDVGQYDAAFLIGYHSGASNLHGGLAHTFTGGIVELRLNGEPASETVFNAALSGYYGVPVVMVSGDDGYTEHVKGVLPGVETVTTKWTTGINSVRTMRPADAVTLLADRTCDVLSRINEFKPYRLDGPVELEIMFTMHNSPEKLAFLKSVERLDARTIRYVGDDMLDVSRFIAFVVTANL